MDGFCVDKSILAIYKTEGRGYIDAEFSPQEYGVATKKDSGFSAVYDDLITGWLADGTDPPAAERRRHLQRPWNRERFGRDGAVRCGLRHLFCHQLHPELHRPLDAGPAEEGTGLCPGKGRIKLKFSFISPFLPIPDLLHRKPVPGQLKRLPGAGFLPPFRGLFVSGRQRFLKTQPNCKKSYNFLIKKGGFPLTALL